MNGEFNDYCSHYYYLTQRLTELDEHFKNLLENALPYTGQTSLAELDAIIKCNRRIQRVKAKMEKTEDEIRDTERIIFTIMRYFEIPPETVLTGEIADELEFEIWADENDTLYTNKTKDLIPPPENANIITIKMRYSMDDEPEDDEDVD